MVSKTQLLKVLAGITILVILVMKVGVKDILKILPSFNFMFIIPIVIIYALSLVLGAINIRILLRGVKKEIGMMQMVKAHVSSLVIGDMTPGKIGEFSIIYFLKKYDIPLGTTAAVSVVDKAITLIVLLILSVWGSFIFMEKYVAVTMLAGGIAGMMALWFVFVSETGRGLIKKYFFRKITDKIKGFSKTLKELAKEKKCILYNIVLTMVKWLLQFASLYMTFFAFGIKLPVLSLLLFATAVLIAFLPVTLGGLGVREVVAVYLFKYAGIKPEIVISVLLFTLAIKYVSNVAMMIYVAKER